MDLPHVLANGKEGSPGGGPGPPEPQTRVTLAMTSSDFGIGRIAGIAATPGARLPA